MLDGSSSLLEISKSLARAGAGVLMGVSYSTFGPCGLWVATLAVWAMQFLPLCLVWSRYGNADKPLEPRNLLADFEGPAADAPPTPLRLT